MTKTYLQKNPKPTYPPPSPTPTTHTQKKRKEKKRKLYSLRQHHASKLYALDNV